MKTETPWKKLEDGTVEGSWWHVDPAKGRIVCDLCPRECHLKPGDRGFCFVRENRDQRMVLSTYGRSTGFCIDPIEKNRSTISFRAPASSRSGPRVAISVASFVRTGIFPSHERSKG